MSIDFNIKIRSIHIQCIPGRADYITLYVDNIEYAYSPAILKESAELNIVCPVFKGIEYVTKNFPNIPYTYQRTIQ